jgi:hypothetical protein
MRVLSMIFMARTANNAFTDGKNAFGGNTPLMGKNLFFSFADTVSPSNHSEEGR